MQRKQRVKIAVVGDVHEQWEVEDEIALQNLGVDLVLFVGDLGNEWVAGVRLIANMALPKAVILGNHDAWYTATEWGRRECPYDKRYENWFQQQLDLLGEAHVGYGFLDFPNLGVTVVGGRPCSWGGSEWKYADFYRQKFDIYSFDESANVIAKAAKQAGCENLIFLGHNGPKGLGDGPDAPCGRDWKPLGEDFGDPDFQDAIQQTRSKGKKIPLVTFGHMHHKLRHKRNAFRRMVGSIDGTVYVNGACVPRIMVTEKGKVRNFSIILMEDGLVSQVSLVWVSVDIGVVSENILYNAVLPTPVIR